MNIFASIINWDLWHMLHGTEKRISTKYLLKKENNMKTIEVCVGIGLNQFFPEYVTIEIPQDLEEEKPTRAKKPKSKVKPKTEDDNR
jgi:hypothetical protein